jgi:hypothetical protein
MKAQGVAVGVVGQPAAHDDTRAPINSAAIIKATAVLMPLSLSCLCSGLFLHPPQGHPDQRCGLLDSTRQFFPDNVHRGPPSWRACAA